MNIGSPHHRVKGLMDDFQRTGPQRQFEGIADTFQTTYPHPEKIAGEQRRKLQESLRSWVKGGEYTHCYLVENDHVVPLDRAHRDTDFGRPKIWQIDVTNNFSGNHYLPTYQHLLQKMEEMQPQIKPGKTTMLEVTTGSAGIAFGHVGQLTGYPRELFAPAEIRENDPARWALMREAVEGNDVCGGKLIAAEGGQFLASAIRMFRERIGELGGGRGQREGRFALPNHSMRAETVEACSALFLGAMQEITVPMDAAVVGIGNGTSAEAMKQALGKKFGTSPALFGYEGKHDPGMWQRLHGPLHESEREDRVWMYGVDGTGNVGMDFRFVQELIHEGALRDIILVSRRECEEIFESLNHGQTVGHSMGRSSAAGISAAARLAREMNYMNVCCVRYDTAAPYGEFIPRTSGIVEKQTVYIGHGNWNNQIEAKKAL
ncbi:MAG: pyridoxal-phosphate dependent enzyme [Candidatus Peribacteraceae bacterium]|nr:pyridoxal-phosphate dependent enzyme [Candidatus Peribacteraceae bacterium]MDD5074410.1 pyridoxal-phosphate dependent enzyme [Candidatus Peribacteraceae bacterium]